MTGVSLSHIERCHDEVFRALHDLTVAAVISDTRGARVRADRKSTYQYLGLPTPSRRRCVAAGFSFTDDAPHAVLATWDGIWKFTDQGDVLFAALDFYRSAGVESMDTALWQTISTWIDRIDNWAHCDDLARVYSFALEAMPDAVYPVLEAWSQADDQWRARVSIVSLIHYTGKNAVFMPVEPVLKLVANCAADQREPVHKAVGWVLRETMVKYPNDVVAFLQTHAPTMRPAAIRRATERLPKAERDHLRSTLL